MKKISFMVMIACLLVPSLRISVADDSAYVPLSLSDGKTLQSKGGKFEFGFFSPGSSHKRYLGIWYMNLQVHTVIWVANRDKPINDSTGILTVNSTGNLVLTHNRSQVWYSNTQKKAQNPVVELLDSGNLVIRNEGESNSDEYLWQSFDYLSDTFLQGMKLGKNLRTGHEWKLTAWNSPDDPSPGDFSRVLKLNGFPEFYLLQGTRKVYRFGPWTGMYFSGTPDQQNDSVFSYYYVSNGDEVSFTYSMASNTNIIARSVINQTTITVQRYMWVAQENNWRLFKSLPEAICDTYAICGPFGNCVSNNRPPACQCLKGFSPKSQQAWNSMDWSQGCKRNTPLSCKDKLTDGFVTLKRAKVPDTTHTLLDESIGLVECRAKCLNNCSCMAYANSDIRGKGSGCVMWFGDLIDLSLLETGGQYLYIRMPASELEPAWYKKNIGLVVACTIIAICGILLSAYFIYRIRRTKAERLLAEDNNEKRVNDLDIQLFDLKTIAAATNDFSIENKIGEGGFGPVYKGILMDGQEIAVKTLARSSWQGVTEFLNEVKLIAKLQHRNLVKLLGCCIDGQENMLVYEYMANGSLDSFIFDDTKSKVLEWPQRFHIICGIARGLMYLHQDSRLRIIHRDLKASNVLLDENLSPKISDFGLAKIFGGDQIEGNTRRVVGTYGYMAPEYAIDGLFSVKSDVFSFGILVLEIVCGKKNRAFCHTDENLNLVGHAWRMWKEGRALELIDSNMMDSCVISEVLRCLHISLLCVQQYPEDRPKMASVILMLESHMELLDPKEHGFISRKASAEESLSSKWKDSSSTNDVTISKLEAR